MIRQSFTNEQVLGVLHEYCGTDVSPNLQLRPSKRGSVAIASTGIGPLIVKYADLSNIETEEQIEPSRSTGIRNEADILPRLPGSLAPTLHVYHEDSEAVYSITGYITGRPLSESHRATRRSTVGKFIRAVSTVHRAGIVHGDLSPDNALELTDGSVKLIDFELAHNDTTHGFAAGLHHYLSPEAAGVLVDGGIPELNIREEAFALAASSLTLLTGNTPIQYARPDSGRKQALVEIASGQPYSVIGASEADMPMALSIREILTSSANDRPATPSALYTALEQHL